MKKILFITHSYAMTGGAEDEFERLLKFFSKKKELYEVHGLFPAGPRAEVYSSYCFRSGTYKYGHLPVIYEGVVNYLKYFLKSVIQLFQVIRFASGQKYDLTVINVVVLIWPALALKIIGKKVIVFIREDIYPIRLRYFVYKFLSKICSFFIPNSLTKEKDFIKATRDNRIKHVYPGIEDESNIQMRKLKNVVGNELFNKVNDQRTFKFINPARILKKKNQLLILKALNELKKIKAIDMPLIIFVGYYDMSSPYMNELLNFINNNSLEKYCIFLGELEKSLLYEIYQYVDATILTSISEGLPIVLVESFKFEKPMISTKVGGIPEIIKDSHNGYLINYDEIELCLKMKKLMEDNDEFKNISSNALKTYNEKFNLLKNMQETESIFNKVMQE